MRSGKKPAKPNFFLQMGMRIGATAFAARRRKKPVEQFGRGSEGTVERVQQVFATPALQPGAGQASYVGDAIATETREPVDKRPDLRDCDHRQGAQTPLERRKLQHPPVAILREQQTALLWIFTRIVASHQRSEAVVPFAHEVQAAFLHPSVEVCFGDRVGIVKDWILRRENLDRQDREEGVAAERR